MQPMRVLELLSLDKYPDLSWISKCLCVKQVLDGSRGSPPPKKKNGFVLSLVLETSLFDCYFETNLALEISESMKCIGYFLATNISLSSLNVCWVAAIC